MQVNIIKYFILIFFNQNLTLKGMDVIVVLSQTIKGGQKKKTSNVLIILLMITSLALKLEYASHQVVQHSILSTYLFQYYITVSNSWD